jgi:tRNA nucleotidyltransferase/poly(A) polymerase
MSDYMFMLESHLTGEQYHVLGQVEEAAREAGLSLYLTGGAMRDILGGFPVRDLDFAVEGNPAKIVKALQKKASIEILSEDEKKKSTELRFPSGVTVELGMTHSEKFSKSAGKPQIAPSTLHDDLQWRDFTINAIALSLNKASLGLLIDPSNGIGDIERKELRTIHNYSFYDDPSRLLRLVRFRVRLGFALDERTRSQVENAKEAGMVERIGSEALGAELRNMAREISPHDLVKALEEEKLLGLFSPALASGKVDYALLNKLQKAHMMVPFGITFHIEYLPLFLDALFHKLNAKEAAAAIKAAALTRGEVNALQKLPPAAKKLERALQSAKLQKASALYTLLTETPGEQILYLSIHSNQRLVQDRIKNYFQKYLPMSQEVTNEMVAAAGAVVGTPKFAKAKQEMILKHLDARPKKVAPPPEPPPPPPPMSGFARGSGPRRAQGAPPPKPSARPV